MNEYYKQVNKINKPSKITIHKYETPPTECGYKYEYL